MKNNKKGFTLVELVIVVAVMAVLVAVAIPTVSSIVGTAEESVAESNAKVIESMIKLEQANNENTSLDETIIDNALTDAKLGITGIFEFNSETGRVVPKTELTTAPKSDTFEPHIYYIDCDAEAEATEEKTEGEVTIPAQTAVDNSVIVTKGTKKSS